MNGKVTNKILTTNAFMQIHRFFPENMRPPMEKHAYLCILKKDKTT